MPDDYELRDHRGHLVEARTDGRLTYARRSNLGRLDELHHGRSQRASRLGDIEPALAAADRQPRRSPWA